MVFGDHTNQWITGVFTLSRPGSFRSTATFILILLPTQDRSLDLGNHTIQRSYVAAEGCMGDF